MAVISELDVDAFSRRTVTTKYPYIILNNLSGVTVLVVSNLTEGDTALVGKFKGETKVLKRISLSATNIDKLLRTHGSVIYVEAEGVERVIKTVEEYMEGLQWTY